MGNIYVRFYVPNRSTPPWEIARRCPANNNPMHGIIRPSANPIIYYSSVGQPSLAFDKDSSTKWTAHDSVSGQWIGQRFESEQLVKSFMIESSSFFFPSFSLEKSKDGELWVPVQSFQEKDAIVESRRDIAMTKVQNNPGVMNINSNQTYTIVLSPSGLSSL